MIRIFPADPSKELITLKDAQGLSDGLEAAGEPLWADIEGEDHAPLRAMAQELKLHPLAVKSCLRAVYHPKVDEFPDYLFIIVHAVNFDAPRDRFETFPINVFLGKGFLLTHHQKPSRTIEEIAKRCRQNRRLLARGPAFLLHEVLNLVVEYYLPILDQFEDMVVDIERSLFDSPNPETLARILQLKRDVAHLKRVALPQREVILSLSREGYEFIDESSAIYFRNVYDHLTRVSDMADSFRDSLNSLMDSHLTVISNRMNEVMKLLTIFATILMPMTVLAGIYGMNFKYMPEIDWKWSYPLTLAAMGGIAAGMLSFFRRKGWI